MKSALVIAWFFALAFTVVNGGAIFARSPFSGCGDGGEVLASNNFEHNGNTIGFVSGTCPQAANKVKRDVLEERQNICTNGGCTIRCYNNPLTTVSLSDCITIVNYLVEQSGTFSVPGGSYHSWYTTGCTIYLLNTDSIPYTACYSTVTYEVNATASTCIGQTNEGDCAGSWASGQKFVFGFAGNRA